MANRSTRVVKTRGPAKGHPGWGGRPKGITMPCGWGCGAALTASEMRKHFTDCAQKPPASKSLTGQKE